MIFYIPNYILFIVDLNTCDLGKYISKKHIDLLVFINV